MTPAVVVLAYERPQALQRLLNSVARARYPDSAQVPLLISLDRSSRREGAETAAIARDFEWRYGPKHVVERPEHLGVVRHFREAGRLAVEHGGAVLLEDDLTVAPAFYEFASQVLDAYGEDPRIGGCCLYGLWFNGFTLEPFTPIDDGNDVFFLGVPHTQGLCFSSGQWSAFEAWWDRASRTGRPGNLALGSETELANSVSPHPGLHPAFLRFGPEEWFPNLAAYLAETGRYFCFPRVSLTVGWGDAGAHFSQRTSWFQTPVQFGSRPYRMPALEDALAVYDGFFELQPDRLKRLAPTLAGLDFDVDLNATKQPANLRAALVLTTRPVRDATQRFGLEMYPPEANVITATPGAEIALARSEDVLWDGVSETEARRRLHEYAWRRHRPSTRRSLRFAAAGAVQALRRVARRNAGGEPRDRSQT